MKKTLFYLILVYFVSCNNEQSNQNSIMNSPNIADNITNSLKKEIDIPIEIKTIRESENDYKGKYLHFVISNENSNVISISPTSDYFDKYVSKKRFSIDEIAYVDEGTGFNEFVTIEYYIINNSINTLNINGLDVIVEKSQIDDLPYLYIATEAKFSNTLTLVDESWYNWGSATLKYKILKKNECFDGTYENEKKINYFDDIKHVNFLSDLIEKGYDYNAVANAVGSNIDSIVVLIINNNNFYQYSNLFYPFEIGIDNSGEYYGFARINGELTFCNSDVKIEFSGKIQLSTSGGFGGWLELNDKFNIELKTEGENYVKHLPYITTIEPGGSERVRMTFKTSKSSNHIFKLKANNENGLMIESKTINLHFLVPKHNSRVEWDEIY